MASSDVFEEIGRLKQQVEHLGEEVRELKESNKMLDEANEQMHEKKTAVDRKLKKSDTEKSRLVDDLRRLNEELEQQGLEIERLHEQIAKQQRTIKVQSDQIATPNDSKKKHWTTPNHAVPPPSQRVDYSRPPPAFILPQLQRRTSLGYLPLPPPPSQSHTPTRVQPASTYAHQAPSYNTPQRQATITSTPYHMSQSQPTSQPGRQQQYAPPYGALDPTIGGVPRRASLLPTRSLVGVGVAKVPTANQGTLIDHRTEEWEVPVMPELEPLFESSEGWAVQYCGHPARGADAALPYFLKEQLQFLTNAAEASALLGGKDTRASAIAKVVNHGITSHSFVPAMITGFRPSLDQKLETVRAENKGPATAIHLRRAILLESARLITEAVYHEGAVVSPALLDSQPNNGFLRWRDRQAHEKATASLHLLAPLLDVAADRKAAFEDLKQIWTNAIQIGLKMSMKPSIWHAEYPPTGPGSMFNLANMRSVDREFLGTPQELMARGLNVRLAITPVVTETDFSGRREAGVAPRCLHMARCLLMP